VELWGGRFSRPPDELARDLNASIGFDRRLWAEDILGSIAHCRMLARQEIISADDATSIVAGLREIYDEIERGEFRFRTELEDIHLNIERRLSEKIGPAAGRLHTACSRNDQVALDIRLYARRVIVNLVDRLVALQEALVGRAEEYLDLPIPGYTHLQRAQPVLLSHHLLAYFEMFQRDGERLRDAYVRADVSPLGSGALAGVPYPIDREFVARELGFAAITRNSLDAVGDRDFLVEISAGAALAMAHLSRLAEELILWTSYEFGFVELDDAYATGSSIMPQKKNPDLAELIRGKTGRVYGDLTCLLTVLKGLPLAYNKDLQEDKEAFFDSVDTLDACLAIATAMIATMRVRSGRVSGAAGENFALATDFADFLVRRGLPFRQAHEVIGRLVAAGLDRGKSLEAMSVAELQEFSPLFDDEVRAITVQSSIDARDVPGGTSSRQVVRAMTGARGLIAASRDWHVRRLASLPSIQG
jgi:argininosuccinate lyase